jgi:hypothetical protein
MIHSSEKYIELEKDLNESYKDFFHFSLDLVKNIEKDNNNLKFAVVNMQIALELFLKYYFLRKGKYEWLFSSKSKYTFNDFSSILDNFFSKDNDLLVTKKKHLQKILEARNKIVHEGKSNWSEDLATNLINTTLFIQNVLNREFQETLINTSYGENDLASNIIWREGTQNFASNIAALNGKEVYECWFCYSRSFIDKKIFSCDEYDDEGFQCVTCFNSFYLHDQIELAECVCENKTFVLDSLNPQDNGNKYNGKCLRCDFSYWAYRCDNCEEYFIDIDEVNIVRLNGKIFCCKNCFEVNKMKNKKL